MKRSEINIGDELYYDRGTSWQQSVAGVKAVVIDNAPYREVDWWSARNRDEPWRRDATGTKVLVEVHHEDGSTYREVVALAHLRGPYKETHARLAEADRRRRDEAREQQRAAEARVQRRAKVCLRAYQVGLSPMDSVAHLPAYSTVAITVDELERLVALAEKAGGVGR